MKVGNRISTRVLVDAMRVADMALISITGLVTFYLRNGFFPSRVIDIFALVAVVVLAANTFSIFRLYEKNAVAADPIMIRLVVSAFVVTIFICLGIGYLTKASDQFSRIWVAAWASSALCSLILYRAVLKWQLRRWQAKGWMTRRLALVGAGDQAHNFIEHFKKRLDGGISIVGLFDDRCTRLPNEINGLKVSGTTRDLLRMMGELQLDEIVIALPWSAEERIHEIVRVLRHKPVNILMCPEGLAFRTIGHEMSDIGDISMLTLSERPLSNWAAVTKRCEDIIVALVLILFTAPLMILVAIAIRMESQGPVIFRQKRFGYGDQLIEVFKFRTLYHDKMDRHANVQVTKNDSRVTQVGRFLRRSNLDELPQLINVLKGDMSIVGPRPHATQTKADGRLFPEVVNDYFARHRVKPGITGWAQVNGWHGEVDSSEKIQRRVEYDLYYIERWSLWFDLRIIMMTPFIMIFSSGKERIL